MDLQNKKRYTYKLTKLQGEKLLRKYGTKTLISHLYFEGQNIKIRHLKGKERLIGLEMLNGTYTGKQKLRINRVRAKNKLWGYKTLSRGRMTKKLEEQPYKNRTSYNL